MHDEATCTCALDPREMSERVAAWREVAAQATARDVQEGRIVAVYPPDPGLRARIDALIAAEAECCSFLKFKVSENEVGTVVELVFPPDASVFVETMLPAVGIR